MKCFQISEILYRKVWSIESYNLMLYVDYLRVAECDVSYYVLPEKKKEKELEPEYFSKF